MSCAGGTCYAGCACHEARWAERLAAAEARVKALEEALMEIAGHRCQLVRDGLFKEPGDCGHVNERHPQGSCASCIARAALAPPAAVPEVPK